ncbi:hypothetical protein SynMITS9220M01_234 [Synechococcus phage SynMITS9220M01]|nr:hypothetical protein SynMITS9220M01_234 [Synechococcus phage SynMITS9220M01]
MSKKVKDLPEWFAQTSEKPYDRHNYRFIFRNGESIIFNSYDQVMEKWFTTPALFKSHVEVLDKPNKNNKNKKEGFK